ncbi:DUF4112 domain-containing protein [Parapedobacter tibetensis]|uniref:DUF4112 domain-containing protein n=1 Tax=Parapedobacter tibetensis TaxID=2972951 RepID=UPI00356B656F
MVTYHEIPDHLQKDFIWIDAIPIIGTVFDFFFKANKKNILLLRAYYYQGKHQGNGNDLLAIILGVFSYLDISTAFSAVERFHVDHQFNVRFLSINYFFDRFSV